jgi:hypothetical protein
MIARRYFWLALLAVSASSLASTGLTAAVPGAPAIPATPSIELPAGSKTAHFTVIVEGQITATKNETLGFADPNACSVSINATLNETTTFRRGRGVVLEFVRLGKGSKAPIIVQRRGRRFDTSHILRLTTTRTSVGSAERFGPPALAAVCMPMVEDLSQGPECGKPVADTQRASFSYFRDVLKLSLAGLGALSEIDCPASQIHPGVTAMLFGWPTPARGDKMQILLPRGLIFGTRRVIVKSVDSGIIRTPTEAVTVGALTGNRTNFGRNKVTIRLVRVP